MSMIFINELFKSIQGEGKSTGCPVLFIRSYGHFIKKLKCGIKGFQKKNRRNWENFMIFIILII